MREKTLFERKLFEGTSGVEAFDKMAANAGVLHAPSVKAQPNAEQSTVTTDIAQTAPFVTIAENVVSKTIPGMLGYVQPLTASVGFVFALERRDQTKITHSNSTLPVADEDFVIVRKHVETTVREVKVDVTDEATQDVIALFGPNFVSSYEKFLASGGEVWDDIDKPLATFFLRVAQTKMTQEINKQFMTWLDTVATPKGSITIADWAAMDELNGVLGELREALYKATSKTSRAWAVCTPRIASYFASTKGSDLSNGAELMNQGRRMPSQIENTYVMTMGDVDIYQYTSKTDVTGGTGSSAEDTGTIYMGYLGGPDVSSIYYMPYNEYIIQGGSQYMTGQSDVFYRVRDSWTTNPLDTLDKQQQTTATPKAQKNSQYVVKADVVFSKKLLK